VIGWSTRTGCTTTAGPGVREYRGHTPNELDRPAKTIKEEVQTSVRTAGHPQRAAGSGQEFHAGIVVTIVCVNGRHQRAGIEDH
jgi:hypothetical protein